MSSNHDDPNRHLAPSHLAPSHPAHNAPLQPLAPARNVNQNDSLMDWIRHNKLAVAIGILALIGLIWWFCLRKNNGSDAIATANANVPAITSANPGRLQVTRTRVGNANALY